jgi:hypothetical protein
MTRRRVSRNAPCPCGSGKKHKQCCWGKDFTWVEEGGELAREVPVPAEVLALLREQARQRLGRAPGAEDRLFAGAPPLEVVEHHLVEGLKRAGVDPALVYAFEQTGRLVTEDNQHLLTDDDLQEWQEAVAAYRARQPASGEGH